MAKAFGILAIVIGVWIGLTVYLEGTDQAFGGVFAFFASEPAGADDANDGPVTSRAAGAFQRAWNSSERRVDDALDQPGAEDYDGGHNAADDDDDPAADDAGPDQP